VRHIETIRGGILSIRCFARGHPRLGCGSRWLRYRRPVFPPHRSAQRTRRSRQPPPVDAATLHRLGFYTAGETTISDDGYAQLFVALYVPGSQTDTTMDRCPKSGIWSIDVSNLTSGDNHTTFGVQIVDPSVATPINLNPLDFSKTPPAFLDLARIATSKSIS